jgi:hypothetical protein
VYNVTHNLSSPFLRILFAEPKAQKGGVSAILDDWGKIGSLLSIATSPTGKEAWRGPTCGQRNQVDLPIDFHGLAARENYPARDWH